ncbi:MAG: HAMP domain-containing histidine kinase [Anaerolineae bacterium]|nr:HAMP domain-containing histidine kinase [Anaerolineae bacterium]
MRLYLTPASLGYLTQLILAGLISGYVLFLARKQGRAQHNLWLSAFLLAITLFITTLFLEVSLLPTQRLRVVYLQNTVLAIALVFLIQFAYHFPVLVAPRRREARFALLVSSVYALWEAGFAIYRFVALNDGIVMYRWGWSDYLLLLVLLWAPIAFLRQLYSLEKRGEQPIRYLEPILHPTTRAALTLRNFALIFLFVASLNLLNILRAAYLLTVSLANVGISLGILLALFMFAMAYINAQPEVTSFIVRLASVALALMLAGLGIVAWVVSPSAIAQYQPDLPVDKTLRFTLNAEGGYEIVALPSSFESVEGMDLHMREGAEDGIDREVAAYCSLPLPFTFPFYGKVYQQVYVCNDGTLGLGQALPYRNYQYRMGNGAPMLMALLVDLYPDISPGAVLVKQEAERLIVTWERQRAFRYPANEFTFQAVLYSDGVFEFSYREPLGTFHYQPNDDPGGHPWAIGALPERLDDVDPEQVLLRSTPASSGDTGVIQDFYMEFRQYLHGFMAPLARLIIIASVFIVIGIPLLIYTNLVQPLNALLFGVRQIQGGNYEVQVPVRYSDEIGFLTHAFNTLAAQLDALIHGLEERVDVRTAELDQANVQLRAEIANREELITDLKAYSRTVAHDLKTPLTLITGYSDLIRDSLPPDTEPELSEFLARISAASAKMIRMIEGILTFSGVRQADLQLHPLAMAAIVTESVRNLQPFIDRTGACVTYPMQWPSVMGHPQWVEEVWSNYLSNALKYGGRLDEGIPPDIELGWDIVDAERGEVIAGMDAVADAAAALLVSHSPVMVRFWVRDHGHGIPEAVHSRLFVPFERLDKVDAEGYGLGLSIVKRMVEKLGGTVGIESWPDAGCRFWFTLPAAEPLPVHEAVAIAEHTKMCSDPALVDRLTLIAAPLLLRLVQATENSDLTDIRAVITEVEIEDSVVGAALATALYNFDYDAILALAQVALAQKGY